MNLGIESEKSCLGMNEDGRIYKVMTKRRKVNFTESPECFSMRGGRAVVGMDREVMIA